MLILKNNKEKVCLEGNVLIEKNLFLSYKFPLT